MSLAFLVLALVLLVVMRERLSDSAASCYVNMTAAEEDGALGSYPPQAEEPNVRVQVPKDRD